MAHDAREQCALKFADDYDTALHIVESIRRKALTASRAQRQCESDESNDSDDGDGAIEYDNDTDDEDVGHEQAQRDRDTQDDTDAHYGNNNNSSNNARFNRGAANLRVQCSTPEAHCASPLKPTQSPTCIGRRGALNSNSVRAVDALRIEPLVELHRIPSGRNLRLKHISQSSKEALSPLTLTPRAPSGKRPSERPSSWSSSSSRQPVMVAALHCSPPPHRSISTGGRTPSSIHTDGARVPTDVMREMHAPPTAVLMRPATRTAAFPQQHDLFIDDGDSLGTTAPASAAANAPTKRKTNQERRCSFTISELALKEMGFARTLPVLSVAASPSPSLLSSTVNLPVTRNSSDDNNNNHVLQSPSPQRLDAAFARLQPPLEHGSAEALDESEEKVVYQFALWKRAGKRKQLPNAISTRMHQQQHEAALTPPAHTESKGFGARGLWGQQQQQQKQQQVCTSDANVREMFANKLQLAEPAALSPARSGADSPSLHLPRSRSPTISAARSLRSFSPPAPAPPASWPLPH